MFTTPKGPWHYPLIKKNAKEVKIAFFIQYYRNSIAFGKVCRHSCNDERGKPEVHGEKPVALPRCTPHMN